MNPTSEDIKDHFESSDVGLGTFVVDMFIGIMPETPDTCICLIDSSGFKPEARYNWERPGLQILVRDKIGNYKQCFTKIKDAVTALHGITNLTINNHIYKCIVAAHEPLFIGLDQNNRPMFSVNFEVQRTSV